MLTHEVARAEVHNWTVSDCRAGNRHLSSDITFCQSTDLLGMICSFVDSMVIARITTNLTQSEKSQLC